MLHLLCSAFAAETRFDLLVQVGEDGPQHMLSIGLVPGLVEPKSERR